MSQALLDHILSHPHGAAGAFRSLVGYPLFGSAFHTLWPLFLMPIIAALLGGRAAHLLPRTPRSWLPAALLAALPGFVALSELWLAMTPSVLSPVDNWRAWLLLWVVPGIGLLLLARALWHTVLRGLETRRLQAAAIAPSPRLRRAAARLGLQVRELPTDRKECFVAGVVRPTAYVSRGALASLSQAELSAALHHERAHVRGRDTLVLSLLSFLADLAPLAPQGAIEVYQLAREAVADRAAISGAGRLSLASALLALARPGPSPVGSLPMAKPETLRWRLQAILERGETPPGSWRRAGLGFAVAALLLAWPYAQVLLHGVFCWT